MKFFKFIMVSFSVSVISVGMVTAVHADELVVEPVEAVVLVGSSVTVPVSNEPVVILVVSADSAVPLPAGSVVVASWRNEMSGLVETRAVIVAVDGVATIVVRVWKVASVTLSYGDVTLQMLVTANAQKKIIRVPVTAPQQKRVYRVNNDPPATGSGVNSSVSKVGERRQRSMKGISWRTGCVPFKDLREVHVNYWGTDGYRYEGVLIVRADVAKQVVAVFTDLYKIGYRFHSVHPEDVYGRNPKGPGANDYASMRAGNTSMFNCRYIVGKESAHAVSPHASGRAIDINPWENPYVSRTGVYPNSWWLKNRNSSPLGIINGSLVVSILAKHGFRWGAYFGDYQHFDG